jgi:DNA mismatch endonuclease (patch repair protein)
MRSLDRQSPSRLISPVPDVFTKAKRSQVMAAIRSKGNKATELKLASILRTARITGWRRHQPLPGRPDFFFARQRLAIFVDGCFWHGCPWHCRMPADNRSYWQKKIRRNALRDQATNKLLRNAGLRVLRVWEHSLRSPQAVTARIISQLSAAPKTGKITLGLQLHARAT